MTNLFKSLFVLNAIALTNLISPAQFSLSGEFRPRSEYRHGYSSLADSSQNNAFFTQQRTRLNFRYDKDKIETKLVLQDVRVWGSESQLNVSDGLTSVHEAWAKAKFKKKWGFKFGRQEITLNDHRIFGNVEWAQQARSHDAVILSFSDSTANFQLGGAYNQNGPSNVGTSYTVPRSYKTFQYLHYSKNLGKLKTSWLVLNLGNQVTLTDVMGTVTGYHDNYAQTIGTNTTYKDKKITLTFNGFYQMGKTAEATARDIRAYLIGINLSYKFSKNTTGIIGYEHQSGNSQTDTSLAYTNKHHAFSPYFGTNHKFNGFMDYFYVGNHEGSVGLQDIYAKLKFKVKKVAFGVDCHVFLTAADLLDSQELGTNGNYSAVNSTLGTEIDTYIGFKLVDGALLKAGYSQLFATRSMAVLKGISDYQGQPKVFGINNWAWLMIVVKPTFINQ